jgi:hypothetical protein
LSIFGTWVFIHFNISGLSKNPIKSNPIYVT